MWTDTDFNVMAHVVDSQAYPLRWGREAAHWVAAHRSQAERGIPYGPHRRQKLDLFRPLGVPKGLVIFLHGGYWQFLSRKLFSHLAAPALDQGWAVALPSYRLAPDVPIPTISRDVIAAATAAMSLIPEGPVRVAGHSAGGHLALRLAMIAPPGFDQSRIDRVVALSPITDLRPYIGTKTGGILGIDAQSATTESPVLSQTRLQGRIWIGSEELPVFFDQARSLAATWSWPFAIAPGRNHFDIVETLSDPTAPITQSLLS